MNRLNYLLLTVSWISFILALANPRWIGENSIFEWKGRHIMMALDISWEVCN